MPGGAGPWTMSAASSQAARSETGQAAPAWRRLRRRRRSHRLPRREAVVVQDPAEDMDRRAGAHGGADMAQDRRSGLGPCGLREVAGRRRVEGDAGRALRQVAGVDRDAVGEAGLGHEIMPDPRDEGQLGHRGAQARRRLAGATATPPEPPPTSSGGPFASGAWVTGSPSVSSRRAESQWRRRRRREPFVSAPPRPPRASAHWRWRRRRRAVSLRAMSVG